MIERRKYVRIDSSVRVRMKTVHGPVVESPAITQNISMGGVRVSLEKKLSLGTRVCLELDVQGELKPIIIVGEVVWQQEAPLAGSHALDTGIRYLRIDSSDMQRLTKYLLGCLKDRFYSKKAAPSSEVTGIVDFLTKEIRLPGDTSATITAPDFLVDEIRLPGDRVRYCGIKAGVEFTIHALDGTAYESKSLSQYISGEGIWFLIDRELVVGSVLEVSVTLPDSLEIITSSAEVVSSKGNVMFDDVQAKQYYEVKLVFKGMRVHDRRKIVRYVYSCRKDYIMLGRHLPPNWM